MKIPKKKVASLGTRPRPPFLENTPPLPAQGTTPAHGRWYDPALQVARNRVVRSFARAFLGVVIAYETGLLNGHQPLALKAVITAAIVAGLRAIEHLVTPTP